MACMSLISFRTFTLLSLWAHTDLVPRPIRLFLVLCSNVRDRLELENFGLFDVDRDQRKVAQRSFDVFLLFRVVLSSTPAPKRHFSQSFAFPSTHGRRIEPDSPVFRLFLDIFQFPSRWWSSETSPQVSAEISPDLFSLVVPPLYILFLTLDANRFDGLLGSFSIRRDGVSPSGESELNSRFLDPPGNLERWVMCQMIRLLHSGIGGSEQKTAWRDYDQNVRLSSLFCITYLLCG